MEAGRPRLWVEPCAGSAAVALRLVGGPYANPPIGMMGGKRGYARVILGVLGLRQGQGADGVVLADAGPWAAVWRVLTSPGGADAVAGVIRAWEGEEPRALWERLRAEGWGDLTTPEEVARWSYTDGNCSPLGQYRERRWDDSGAAQLPASVLASRVSACARWLVCGAWAFRAGEPDSGFVGDATFTIEKGRRPTAGDLSNPPRWPVPVSVYGDARAIPIPADCTGVYVYADPSYRGTTGYASNIYAEDLREYLLEWSRRGAVVAISEARPLVELMGDGWQVVKIDGERRGQKRTFSKQRDEYLTINREPAIRPVVGQLALWGTGG